MTTQPQKTEQGGVLLLVLIIMIVFIAMTTYTLRFVVRQSHETINQEQEEQAFWAADSGVSYALWLLDPSASGGGMTPNNIVALPPLDTLITDRAVTDDLGAQIASFSFPTTYIAFDINTNTLQLRSIGRDVNSSDKCQSIDVKLRQLQPGEPYIVTKWDHKVGNSCPP